MVPYISIIIPVYQAEKTLDRCVCSVLEQKYSEWEMILVDDGAKDRSGALCDGYAAEDSRIRVIHQANAGVSSARNAGIQNAKGTYLLFLDSDDALLPNALSLYAAATENGSFDVVMGGLSVIENGREAGRIGFDTKLHAGREIWEQICRDPAPFGYAGGKLIRRAIVQKNAIAFHPAMQSQEDLDFFLSAYSFCERFLILSDCVYAYYYAPPNRTPATWDFVANQLKLLRIARERWQLSDQAIACVQNRILSLLYTGLYTAAEQGSFDEMVQRMVCVTGLKEFLSEVSAKGEHRIVAKAFVSGKYWRIKAYVAVRNRIRALYRRIKRENH